MIVSFTCRPLTAQKRLGYLDFKQSEKLLVSSFKFDENCRKMFDNYGYEDKFIQISCDESSKETISTQFMSVLEISPKRCIPNIYFVLGKPGSGNI